MENLLYSFTMCCSSIISGLVGHTHLLFISSTIYANNDAWRVGGWGGDNPSHTTLIHACLCSNCNLKFRKIVKPPEFTVGGRYSGGSRGGCRAQGGDGDGDDAG